MGCSSHSQTSLGIDQSQTGVAIGFNLLLASYIRRRRQCDVPCIAPTCVNNIKRMSTKLQDTPPHSMESDSVTITTQNLSPMRLVRLL